MDLQRAIAWNTSAGKSVMEYYIRQNNSKHERGALMVTVLVIVAALMLIGSLVISIVVTDRNISRNYKTAKDAFYVADGGHPLAVSVIENTLGGRGLAYEGMTLHPSLRNEAMDLHRDDSSLNDGENDTPELAPDVRGTLLNQPLHIDIDRTGASLLPGGSAEFASGAEGIGFGSGGSKKILFSISSRGCLTSGACSQVITTYRSVW